MIITGKAKWAKITGKPHPGYDKTKNEWSIDVYIDDETVKAVKAAGLKESIKEKGAGPYMTFKRKELKQDGSPNQPIRIVDHHGDVLQDKDIVYKGPKIGNDSVVDVNFALNEFKPKQFNANILSLMIWELVPYEGGEFRTREGGDDTKTTGEDWSAEAA